MRIALAHAQPPSRRAAPQRQLPIITRAGVARAMTAALVRVDTGWLYLAAGLALLASVALIPAQRQLVEARAARDRAAAMAAHETHRLRTASDFLDRLRAGDPALLEALALDQLRQAPVGKAPLEPYAQPTPASAPLAWIEPAPIAVNTVHALAPVSMLARLATNDQARLLTMALAAAMVFAGLLPPATSGRPRPRRNPSQRLHQRRLARHRGAQRIDLTSRRSRRAATFPQSALECSR